MIRAAGATTLGAACAALAAWLAWHHPLSPAAALAGCGLLLALALWRPARWPLWLLPLLPLIGLMPWTGWLVVEEFDLAVLAVAAGVLWRMAAGWPAPQSPDEPVASRLGPVLLWLLPVLVATLVALQRGVADAGGLSWGWWQGFREPLNSLRLAKPLFEVLLLLPLWRAACRADATGVQRDLRRGLVLLLLGVALAVLWERLAFTGLLDFSSDYRATGPFWEMHVGGAALDAVLAMTLPWAVAMLADARTAPRWLAAAAVVALTAYAGLVTFSRIVYLALPLGLLVWWVLRAYSRRGVAGAAPPQARWTAALAAVAWLTGGTAATAWCFPASGYRGVLALVGSVVVLLPLPELVGRLRPRQRLFGALAGAVGAALVAALAAAAAKGAYLAYALAWSCATVALLRHYGRRRPASGAACGIVATAAFIATLAAQVAVGLHWGGAKALPSSAGTAAVLGAVAFATALRAAPLWPAALRWQGQVAAGMAVAAAVVTVFGGGAYMGGRMATSVQDGEGREAHWRDALRLLNATDRLVGKGLGRYWTEQALSGRPADQTGDYRWLPKATGRSGSAVVLTSGRHILGWGEAFRLSQRVGVPAPGPGLLRLDMRTDGPVKIQAEVCEKHLLYAAVCIGGEAHFAEPFGAWRTVEVPLRGNPLSRGPWYAPRLIAFSISLGSNLNKAEIVNLHLIDAAGREMLTNGDLGAGMAHWFFTSDRYHLPWHAKNLAVHLIFEQGLLGLVAYALLLAAALWRVSAGAARAHPLASALAAAMVGMLTVGLVDSLLDMPRVAFLVLLLPAIALSLPARQGAQAAASSP